MRPFVIYTLNELKKLVPSFREECMTTTNPKIKKIVDTMFYNLGCDMKYPVDIQKDVTCMNRFGELDDSVRYVLAERTDIKWLDSGNASNSAKCYTEDLSLHREMFKMKQGVFSTKNED